MPNRVTHFEIHVTDIEAGKKFYGDAFGWQFVDAKMGMPYWLIMTAPKNSKEPGINGGMLTRNACKNSPSSGPNAWVCTVQVDDFDAIHKKIMGAGGTVAMPKGPIPGMAWIGYYHDPDGNIFGLFQEDKKAK
jgi:predicted enzyme related to lactoylglutathione lyase